MASTNRVMSLLDVPITIRSGDRPLSLSDIRGDIRFQRVTFAYSQRQPILKDLDFNHSCGTNHWHCGRYRFREKYPCQIVAGASMKSAVGRLP